MSRRLVALRPVLHLATQYKAGDELPAADAGMVAAWLEAGSARWEGDGGDAAPEAPPRARASRAAAEPGVELDGPDGPRMQGKPPKRARR